MTRRKAWCAAWAVAIVAMGASAGPVSAQAGRGQVQDGNKLYKDGRFDEAHRKYLEALQKDPESPLIRFDDGNALYKKKNFKGAAEAYHHAVESGDPQLASSAWYNLGNAFYRSQQLQQSAEAYKQALRLNPNDRDAKHNLEHVLKRMQQQPQQRQQQPQQGQQKNQQGQQQQQGQQNRQQGQQDQKQGGKPGQQQQPRQQPRSGRQGQDQTKSSPGNDERAGQAEPQPGAMSAEDARRLLNALREDPGEVNRKPALPPLQHKPRKDW